MDAVDARIQSLDDTSPKLEPQPVSTTFEQLKQKIQYQHPSHPGPGAQLLIYPGQFRNDNLSLSEVLSAQVCSLLNGVVKLFIRSRGTTSTLCTSRY